MQPPPAPTYARVTLLVAGRRVDLALPVDVALAELVPMVLELASPPGGGRPPVPWRISGVTGGPLPPDATLDELGVLDGDLLRLGPDTPPTPPPVFDDPVDALAAVAEPGGSRDRHRTAVIAVPGIVLAAAALLSGVGSKDPVTGPLAPTTILLAALGAVGTLVAAAVLTRVRGGTSAEARRRAAATVAAHCAVPLAAVAGWSALPGPPGPARLLVAAAAGGAAAALGQVAVRLVAPALVAAVVLAALVAATTAAGLRFPLGVPALAALAGAVALCMGPWCRGSRCGSVACPVPWCPRTQRVSSRPTPGPTCCRPRSCPTVPPVREATLPACAAGAPSRLQWPRPWPPHRADGPDGRSPRSSWPRSCCAAADSPIPGPLPYTSLRA